MVGIRHVRPSFQNPPLLSGILGAPSAPPFGARGGAGRTRGEGLRRPGGALASGDALTVQGGAGPPLPEPPLLSGILGAPLAPPFGPGCQAWRSREEGLRRPGGALASGDALAA